MENSFLQAHLAAIKRSVQLVSRNDSAAATVSICIPIPLSDKDLWTKFTDPEQLSECFLPVSGDLKVGGTYAFEGNARGSIIACEPFSKISVTWEMAGTVSWLDLQIQSLQDSQCELTLSHTSPTNPHWDQYGAGATGVGWETALLGFRMLVSQPDAPRMDELAFVTSDEGTSFIESCCEGWVNASVSAGIDRQTAESAAHQTSAFYRGVDP